MNNSRKQEVIDMLNIVKNSAREMIERNVDDNGNICEIHSYTFLYDISKSSLEFVINGTIKILEELNND